ncbi:ceramide kinase [Elysia marginata]|uniref:Ceramide kinase n=1 Tax=Elysia marginata TaxID=1093978 RepID=A0AAV4HJC9_9GAST|nr:ceramide kinase [Elysia marginata]
MAESKGTETQPPKQDELPEAERSPTTGEQCEARGEKLMSAAVQFSNQDMNLVLYEQGLVIEQLDNAKKEKTTKTKGLSFQWCDVISAENPHKDEQKQTLLLHYIEKQKNKCLRKKSVTVTVTGDNFDSIFSNIQDQCQKVPNRPKKLFVLINPIGGNRKGVQIYERKIAPIFALANCETTVVTSERAKHALEIGETQDFTGYDGNGTVRYTNDGVIDLETSALRVLRGEIHPLNIVTVHEPGKLVGICGLAFGIGLITDLIKHSDDRRWMKKARYIYSIAAVLLKKRRMYDAQIEYILSEDDGDKSTEDGSAQPRKEWTTFDPEGKRYACTAFLVSRMVNVENKTIVDPYSDSGLLVLDTGCSNMGFFKYARTMMAQTPADDIPNLHIKDKAVGLKVKILREDPASNEKQDDKSGEAASNEDGESEPVGKKEVDDNEEKEGKEDVKEMEDTNKPEGNESSQNPDQAVETEKKGEENQQGKPEPAKAGSVESKAGERKNKKAEAIARATARDTELEHYIYLDGEVRRVDGLEFECRLHSSFVPMFGCLAAELVNAKTA